MSILTPPALCLGVLCGIAAINATHKTPADAAPYHARAKIALEGENGVGGFAWNITDPSRPEDGIWVGKEVPPAKEAVRLLKPNCIISREYTDTRSNDRYGSRNCSVLIVQCRDSRDMVGHYPENCYPHIGELMVDKRERDWTIDGLGRSRTISLSSCSYCMKTRFQISTKRSPSSSAEPGGPPGT